MVRSDRWDPMYERYSQAKRGVGDEVAADLRRLVAEGVFTEADFDWFGDGLSDADRKWFAAWVIRDGPADVVARLFDQLIRAAVYEVNPSANRYFVEPCVQWVGADRTWEALLHYVKEGSDFEKAGAFNASYWVKVLGRVKYAGVRRLYLEEFIRNPDLNVRRSLVAHLSLARDSNSPEKQQLIMAARRIALSHPDDYIRGRAEGELHVGSTDERLYFPLPHRPQPDSGGPATRS